MMIFRRLLTLSASAALHAAALGFALGVAGVGAGSAVLVDLVADVEDITVHEAPAPSTVGSASTETERARTASARRVTGSPARPVVPAQSAVPAPAPSGPLVTEPDPPPRAEPAVEARRSEPPPEADPSTAANARVHDPAGPSVALEAAPPAAEGVSPRTEGAAAAPGATSGVDTGSSTGESARAGSTGGGNGPSVALATPGDARGGVPPEYGAYLQRFRRRVQESLEYPLAARRQGLSGKVELEVLLAPSGRIDAVRVISSSSHAVLDDAALRAVRRLAPEPFPDHLPRRPLRIRLPLGFELE